MVRRLDPKFKMLMHPIDAKEGAAPSGEGWIVQIVCHHYNPYPDLSKPEIRKQLDLPASDRRKTSFGPVQFLTDKVLPKLNLPQLRLFGIHHVAVGWLTTEKEWTNEKGQGSNNLASRTVPLLDRAAPPAAEGGGASAGGPGERGPGGMGAMGSMMSQMKGAGAMGSQRQGGGMQEGMMRGMMGMGGAMGQAAGADDLKKKLRTLTRTDFLIQFVWQPKKEEERPKTDEERAEALKKIVADLTEAEKNNPAIKVSKEEMEKELEAVSRKKSDQIESQISAGAGQPGAPGAPGGPAAATPPGAVVPPAGPK